MFLPDEPAQLAWLPAVPGPRGGCRIDPDIAQHFGNDGEGRYDVHTRVRVATRALEP